MSDLTDLLASAKAALATLPEADFYEWRDDCERLDYTDPVEALTYCVDGWTDEAFAEGGSVTLYAYRSIDVTENFIANQIDRAMENVEEAFGEEYGDPEDQFLAGPEATARAKPLFEVAIRSLLKDEKAWRCDKIGKVTLDAAQVEALMREANPEWYTDSEARGLLTP